jgi:hypothetical protein
VQTQADEVLELENSLITNTDQLVEIAKQEGLSTEDSIALVQLLLRDSPFSVGWRIASQPTDVTTDYGPPTYDAYLKSLREAARQLQQPWENLKQSDVLGQLLDRNQKAMAEFSPEIQANFAVYVDTQIHGPISLSEYLQKKTLSPFLQQLLPNGINSSRSHRLLSVCIATRVLPPRSPFFGNFIYDISSPLS